ncbi:MAG: UDP-2,3-diacylglucosamine diphosphatase [Rhodospirillales bacterium]
MNALPDKNHRYRAIWISDVHLGTPGCKAEYLLDFLKYTESDYLYLVGDIIDGWRMRRSWYWCQTHNDIIQKLMRKARKGTRVIYVPGNHDENFRDFAGRRFGRVAILDQTVHVTADGRKFLVLHGDQFDSVVKYAKWLALLGDWAYGITLKMNDWLHQVRRVFGFPYWSLSAFLKHKVKNAVEYISRFEDAVIAEARRHKVDGVVCGHIHHAEIREVDGLLYCNDGDWVESCTALVEHLDGRLELINWIEQKKLSPVVDQSCAYSSSRTPGFRKSMASFGQYIRSAVNSKN